jgi:small subunit ribosomal protein S10
LYYALGLSNELCYEWFILLYKTTSRRCVIMSEQKLKIRLRSYDPALLDKTAKEVVKIIEKVGNKVNGPIPLPLKIEKFTLNTSPHVNKKAREQFEIRTSKRLIIVNHPTPQIIEELDKLNVPGGVDIELKIK